MRRSLEDRFGILRAALAIAERIDAGVEITSAQGEATVISTIDRKSVV